MSDFSRLSPFQRAILFQLPPISTEVSRFSLSVSVKISFRILDFPQCQCSYSHRYRLIMLWLFYPENAAEPPPLPFFSMQELENLVTQVLFIQISIILSSGIYNHRTRIIFTTVSGVWQGTIIKKSRVIFWWYWKM